MSRNMKLFLKYYHIEENKMKNNEIKVKLVCEVKNSGEQIYIDEVEMNTQENIKYGFELLKEISIMLKERE